MKDCCSHSHPQDSQSCHTPSCCSLKSRATAGSCSPAVPVVESCCSTSSVSTPDSSEGASDGDPDCCIKTAPSQHTSIDISRDEWLRVARRAKLLSWFSLFYIGIEGTVGVVAGVLAGSIALIGFGIDSFIEALASLVIVWRFSGSRLLSSTSEHTAQKLVAWQFFLLAPYVAFESVQALIQGARPEVSTIGMVLTASSLIGMPILGRIKERMAAQMGSTALRGEGRQNMLCAMLAGAVFIGLAANALFGAWWMDAVIGLCIAAIAVKEGFQTLRGEGCCAPTMPVMITPTHPVGCACCA